MTAAAAPFDGALPRRVRDRRGRAGAGGRRSSAAAGATDAVDAQLVLAADQFAIDDRRAARPRSPAIRGSASGRAT